MTRLLMKKGGGARILVENFVNYDKFTIPTGYQVVKATVKKIGTTAGNIKLGTYVVPVREVQTYTVTAEPTASGNLSVVLNGATGVNIAIVDADTIYTVADKLGAGTYPGWTTVVTGAAVRFVSTAYGVKAGAYTISGVAGVTGAFVETVAGVTESSGEQTVASVALSVTDGNIADLSLVKSLYETNTEVRVGVTNSATGTLAIQLQKLF